MKKKLMSIALSAVLAGSAAAPCFAAETVAASAASESLAEIVQAGLPDEVIPTETPTADCVSYECSYSYEGVAVTCADIEALKENGLNGVPVEWSDGIWSSYWWPSGTEFLIQPLEGLSKEFGFYGKYEHFGDEVQDDGKENSFPIPAECTGLDEPVYVLYTPKADAARLEAALASDSTVTVIGALFCGILQPVNEAGIILDIMPYRAAATTAKIVPFTPKAPAGNADGKTDAVFTNETEKAFCERIAGWENVSFSDCILLHPQDDDMMLLTPDKPYRISRIRAGCYRIYTDGAAPDADVVLAKWKEMLRIAGYPEKTLERFKCEITEADGGYDVQVNQDSYGKCSIIECLKQFPAVKKIDAQFGYRTDDHVNGSSCWHFLFQCDREPVPADFPSLNVYSIALSDSNWFDGWEMYLDTESYADYYAAARTMLESKIVRDLHFSYISTLLLDDNDDAQILLPERTVVWERGASGETARRGPVKVSPQFLEWNLDEEALKNGEPGSFAGTATQFLLVGLAFRWNANGTPVGAEIGGCTLTAADGWLNQTKGLVEDIHTFAAALPGTEHYDECTPYVPDDLLESGLWIAGGILDEAFAAALLNDPRIDAQGLLYITETKNLYLDAPGEAALEEDLRFDEISACLRPLEFAEIGDVDGDGQVTAYDATLALTAFSEKTAGYADGERTLTPAQEQIADVDGDGELTAFDATMILTYFNLKYNTGFDDITWADILPET